MKNGFNKQFADEVVSGLSMEEKRLSSKWLYNKRGDELFIEIMNLPEYYLTRCELEIFQSQSQQIVKAFNASETPFDLIELGAGDGTKTIELLKALKGREFTYRPIDISQNSLDHLQNRLRKEFDWLDVKALQGDYFSVLSQLNTGRKKIVLFLGSNIGNLHDHEAQAFMSQLDAVLNHGDRVLLGVDLIKDTNIVLPAYNDPAGVTAKFNLNILDRINAELGGDFDRLGFEHAPLYNEKDGWAKSYLRSKTRQTATLSKLNKAFQFEEGELIFMEISRKYNDSILNKILDNSELGIVSKFTDQRSYFCDYMLEKAL